MSYSSYLFTMGTPSSLDTIEIRVHIKTLKHIMENYNMNWEDSIRDFEMLTRFVNEVDMLNMREVQDFAALPNVLSETVETQFRTNLSGESHCRGVIFCLKALQYRFRTYATPTAMWNALENLHSMHKRDDELEEGYLKRFHGAIHRCGNVLEDNEKMTLYIDGLMTTTRTIVASYRERVPSHDMTFQELTHFSSSYNEAVRAHSRQSRPYANDLSTPQEFQPSTLPHPQFRTSSRSVHALEDDVSTPHDDNDIANSMDSNNGRQLYTDNEEDFHVFYVINQRQRPQLPLKVLFDDAKTTRLGLFHPRSAKLSCHTFYTVVHIALQCTLKLYHLQNVFKRY